MRYVNETKTLRQYERQSQHSTADILFSVWGKRKNIGHSIACCQAYISGSPRLPLPLSPQPPRIVAIATCEVTALQRLAKILLFKILLPGRASESFPRAMGGTEGGRIYWRLPSFCLRGSWSGHGHLVGNLGKIDGLWVVPYIISDIFRFLRKLSKRNNSLKIQYNIRLQKSVLSA